MKPTIKAFIQSGTTGHIQSSLVRAVIRQSGGIASFAEDAESITNHGIDGGFHGWIYHKDTVAFTKRNKAAIMELCKDTADNMGMDNAYSLIASFGCAKGYSAEEVAEAIHNSRSEERTMIYNCLAWFAVEEVARAYCDMLEG